MTLQQLEYIIAVDECRHFARAAEQCRVTQPTLSAMIQKLEDELGARIFDRNRQPIAPTAVGELVIKQARETLRQSKTIQEVVFEEKASLGGVFRLGILPTIAPYLLPRFFPQLMSKYKGLDIQVAEMKTKDIKQALIDGKIDAGILAQIDGLDDYYQTPLLYEQYFAYVSQGSGLFDNKLVRTSDLAGEQLWLLDEGHCFRDQLLRFCQLKSAQVSQLAYRLGSMETFMRMVESGKGVTFIPELAVEQLGESQKQLVRPFAIPVPTRQLVMITNKTFIRETLLKALVNDIQKCVPKGMLSLKGTQKLV
ncbi:MAG: hydrogen peroxide-inducible genes activator [Bacteroidaceae bacterium]|nr:hydrogen peroxide-inducible genes activator [Bacteroidaceae bacterium]MBQ4055507.1 hydrogen peroxide-inducible genes activator [Bacteroidaceae bacterium]MBR6621173.1 hydrogen peroxide-inducible genes activator [Bacteroides sp.]